MKKAVKRLYKLR